MGIQQRFLTGYIQFMETALQLFALQGWKCFANHFCFFVFLAMLYFERKPPKVRE
jgi:hypothetical protein